ncbi:hypothetical protein KEM55_004538, partial [Ascosphaera atra]
EDPTLSHCTRQRESETPPDVFDLEDLHQKVLHLHDRLASQDASAPRDNWGPSQTAPPMAIDRLVDGPYTYQRLGPDQAPPYGLRHPYNLPSQTHPWRAPPLAGQHMEAANNPVEVDRQRYAKWDAKQVGIFYPDNPAVGALTTASHTIRRSTSGMPAPSRKASGGTLVAIRALLLLNSWIEGDAVEWYAHTVRDQRREFYFYHPRGVEAWLQDLEDKFRLNPVRAKKKLQETTYGPENVQEGKAVDSYVAEVRNALRGMNNVVTDQNLVHTAWYNLDPSYRNQVGPPAPTSSIQDFAARADRYRTFWEEEKASRATPVPRPDRPSCFRFPSRQANLVVDDPEAESSPPEQRAAYTAQAPEDETVTLLGIVKGMAAQQERMFEHLRRRARGRRSDRWTNRPWDGGRKHEQGRHKDFYPSKNEALDSQLEQKPQRSANHAAQESEGEAESPHEPWDSESEHSAASVTA